MATLKEYLEKTILKVGSRGAMPGTQKIDILSEDKTGFSSKHVRYIAPSDGYVCASMKANTSGFVHMYSMNDLLFSCVYQAANQGGRARTNIPVKKGETVQISTYSDSTALNHISFIKSVGGGLKSLIYKLFPEVRHAYA